MRHFIQSPIKTFGGFLGILIAAFIWEVKQGEDYNLDADVLGVYNSLASETKSTTAGVNALLQAAAFGALYWVVTIILPPLCINDDGLIVLDAPNSIGNGTCGVSKLGDNNEEPKSVYNIKLRNGLISDPSDVKDWMINGANQLFQPFAIYRDLIVSLMRHAAGYIFWIICAQVFSAV